MGFAVDVADGDTDIAVEVLFQSQQMATLVGVLAPQYDGVYRGAKRGA